MTKEARELCIAVERLLGVMPAPSETKDEEGRMVAEAELERALKEFEFSENWGWSAAS